MFDQSGLRRAAYERGVEAESQVAQELELKGWVVLARNWRGAGGELDLVVRLGDRLRFVEVKARMPDDDSGADAIDEPKQRRLIRAAEAWLAENGATGDLAFLVAVVSFSENERWSIEWMDDAFDGG